MYENPSLRIDLRRAASERQTLQIHLGEDFFKSLHDDELLGGDVDVTTVVSGPRAGVYRVKYTIEGTLATPCNRCMGTMAFPVRADDERYVTSYDSDAEPTDEAPLAERGEYYDISHDVFETLALARPLDCHHATDECNAEALQYIISEE